MAKDLNQHYHQLLALEKPWQVKSVNLDLEAKSVCIRLEHPKGHKVKCPQCRKPCTIADHGSQRTWRHLDTMQFETLLIARVPRADCKQCGIKTIDVSWARKHSRFTLLFEAFVIAVLQSAATISHAARLTGLDWSTLHTLMERAVEAGLQRRELEDIAYVGIDEKSFRRGHNYISVLSDLQAGRVIELCPGRTKESAGTLFESLPKALRDTIQAVAMDMWPAFINSCAEHLPQAAIVHDRFHISQHLNQALDQIRRAENKSLRREGDDTLCGSKYLWLSNPANLAEDKRLTLEALRHNKLKTARAWAIKEYFAQFWQCLNRPTAQLFFKLWYSWAIRSRLEPIKKVARMLKNHLENILNYFEHPITNAGSEGLNSKIQSIKSAARGFHSFKHYRTRILFFCGGLDLTAGLPDYP